MKTFLKSNDKSDEQFLKLEKRTMGRGEVIKQSSATEPAQQHWLGFISNPLRKPKATQLAISGGVSEGASSK